MDSVAALLNQGLTLTLIGMTVVFVLLTVLVGVVRAMSAFCRLVAGAEPVADEAALGDELLGVIAAALRHYRREQA